MPAGVSWPRYLSFFTAAMISMFAGSQTVHYYYKPLDDLNELIEKELEKRNKDKTGLKETNNVPNSSQTSQI